MTIYAKGLLKTLKKVQKHYRELIIPKRQADIIDYNTWINDKNCQIRARSPNITPSLKRWRTK